MNCFIPLLLVGAVAQSPPRQLLSPRQLQGPGNGISKSTYSCNDPIAAKKFLMKYFNVENAPDSCTNDVCVCSGSGPTWYIQQGRVYIPYNSGANGEGRRLQDPGNGFGLHCVNVSNHLTTGGLSTAEVEAHFKSKLGDMKEYDSFMDYSVTLYTSSLAQYAAAFDKDEVPYYTTTSQDQNGESYTSLIVQVDKSQMILELTSKKSLASGETRRPVHASAPSERRVSARASAMINELEKAEFPPPGPSPSPSGSGVSVLSVNRAVSAATLAKLDDFYVNGMGTKKVSDDTDAANGYTRKCYLWTGATVDLCFTSRDDSATKGDWKVADFENMLNTVHKNIIVGHPYCGKDKWEDNHYAIDSFNAQTSNIISYINKNSVPHICSSGGGSGAGISYIFEPTGFGIQADLSFSTLPNDCNSAFQNSSRRLQGTFNPACDPGTCGGDSVIV